MITHQIGNIIVTAEIPFEFVINYLFDLLEDYYTEAVRDFIKRK